jgi:hypothetical protein
MAGSRKTQREQLIERVIGVGTFARLTDPRW